MPSRTSRRTFLAASTLALVGGAGCTGDSTVIGAPSDNSGDAADDYENSDDGNENSSDESESGDGETDRAAASAESDDVLFTVSDGDEEVELATYGDVATVGEIETSKRLDGYHLPMTLTDDGADAFADGLDAIGAFEDPTAHEISTHFDGGVIYTATLGPDLAAAIEEGDWDGEMLVQFEDREIADEMRAALDGA